MRTLWFAILVAAFGWLPSTAWAQATLTLSLANAYPGQAVTVTGASFGAKEAVDIYFETADTRLLVSGGAGAFTAPVTVPASQQPGTAYITAIGRHSGLAAQAALNITTPWVEDGYGAGHHRRNPYENTLGVGNASSLGVTWSAPTAGEGNGSTPAVSTGRVIVSTFSNVAVALARTTGAVLWTGPAGESFSSPAVFNGSVYTASDSGTVYDLNLTTGATNWSKTLSGKIRGSPVVSNGVVYISVGAPNSVNGVLYALNASTGAQIWSFINDEAIESTAAVVNGIVYIGSLDTNVYALDATTGALLWNYATGGIVEGSPAVANGVVYIGSSDSKVYALNAKTGSLRWTFPAKSGFFASPAYSQGIVYAGGTGGDFYALNALNGNAVWTFPTNGGTVASATVANGVVYFTDGQSFYAVSVATGGLLTSSAMASTAYGGPSVSDGVVYLNVEGDCVYALSINGGVGPKRPPASPPLTGTLFPDRSLKVSP